MKLHHIEDCTKSKNMYRNFVNKCALNESLNPGYNAKYIFNKHLMSVCQSTNLSIFFIFFFHLSNSHFLYKKKKPYIEPLTKQRKPNTLLPNESYNTFFSFVYSLFWWMTVTNKNRRNILSTAHFFLYL